MSTNKKFLFTPHLFTNDTKLENIPKTILRNK